MHIFVRSLKELNGTQYFVGNEKFPRSVRTTGSVSANLFSFWQAGEKVVGWILFCCFSSLWVVHDSQTWLFRNIIICILVCMLLPLLSLECTLMVVVGTLDLRLLVVGVTFLSLIFPAMTLPGYFRDRCLFCRENYLSQPSDVIKKDNNNHHPGQLSLASLPGR